MPSPATQKIPEAHMHCCKVYTLIIAIEACVICKVTPATLPTSSNYKEQSRQSKFSEFYEQTTIETHLHTYLSSTALMLIAALGETGVPGLFTTLPFTWTFPCNIQDCITFWPTSEVCCMQASSSLHLPLRRVSYIVVYVGLSWL